MRSQDKHKKHYHIITRGKFSDRTYLLMCYSTWLKSGGPTTDKKQTLVTPSNAPSYWGSFRQRFLYPYNCSWYRAFLFMLQTNNYRLAPVFAGLKKYGGAKAPFRAIQAYDVALVNPRQLTLMNVVELTCDLVRTPITRDWTNTYAALGIPLQDRGGIHKVSTENAHPHTRARAWFRAPPLTRELYMYSVGSNSARRGWAGSTTTSRSRASRTSGTRCSSRKTPAMRATRPRRSTSEIPSPRMPQRGLGEA